AGDNRAGCDAAARKRAAPPADRSLSCSSANGTFPWIALSIGRRRDLAGDALDRAGEGEHRLVGRGEHAAQEDDGIAGTGDLAPSLDQFALAHGGEKLAGKGQRDARALQDRRGGRKQAVVRKRHEAAAMDVVAAIEMLLLDPE